MLTSFSLPLADTGIDISFHSINNKLSLRVSVISHRQMKMISEGETLFTDKCFNKLHSNSEGSLIIHLVL